MTKNAMLDKDAEGLIMFEDIIGQSFIFAHNDEAWKLKRKGCAHAFYKDRLVLMNETLKEKTEAQFERWAKTATENGFCDIDMSTEFSEILARNIIHVSFGEDLSDEKMVLKVKGADGVYKPQTLSVKQAINVIIDQVCFSFYRNVQNPINWFYLYLERVFSVSSETEVVRANCTTARDWIKDYIAHRRAGTRKSSVKGDTDILTLMLGQPKVFSDDTIVDELLGFFGAATDTTHNSMKTILTYFTKNGSSLAKVRDEFDGILNAEISKEKDLQKLSFGKQLKEIVTIDNCFDLEYLNMVILEGLRF